MLESVTVFGSSTNATALGVTSAEVQLGPREPMKDVFPNKALPCTVKLVADEIAIANPNAPDSSLLRTVPDLDTLLPYWLPNHVLGPIAIPILREVSVYRSPRSTTQHALDDSILVIGAQSFPGFLGVGSEPAKD